MGGTEDTDGDFSSVGHWSALEGHNSRGCAIERRQRTQELLQLHDGAARSQLVVDRVPVGVVLVGLDGVGWAAGGIVCV